MTTVYDSGHWVVLAQTWGPRIGVALVILVVAWFVARLVKTVFAKGVDRLPLAAKQNQGAPEGGTVGARLGTVAYWLILLFGVIAALNVLQLDQVVAPLNVMLTNVLSYVPNIVGAGLIFFIGFIVASLAQRVVTSGLQAANVDQMLSKVGLSGASGTGLASAIGTLVFVLIIVPVAIAALQALKVEAISTPAVAVLTTILNAIPNVVAAGIVLAIGILIGRWIGGVVEQLLPASGIDKLFSSVRELSSYGGAKEQTAAEQTAPALAAEPPTASKIVGGIVTFAVIAFSAAEAARFLHFAILAAIITQILGLAGRVILGAAIIAVGVVIADLLANAIGRSMSEADKFAAGLVKWATIALAVAMGLRSMGIADEIVILAFGLILGSAAVAAALAFGLGAREAAGRVASQWVDKAQKKTAAK